MQKFLNWLEKVLTPLAKVIGENKYLIAIRDGFLISTPLLIVGSFFLLAQSFCSIVFDIGFVLYPDALHYTLHTRK